MVVAHSLLGDNDLFRAIDDEVSSLVEGAVLPILHSLKFVEFLQLAELGPQHYWYLSDEDLVLFVLLEHLLNLLFSLLSLRVFFIVVVHFFLGKGDVGIQLGGVSQIPDSRLMRKHWFVLAIGFQLSWMLTDTNLSKLDFPDQVFTCFVFLSSDVLRHNVNLHLSNLVDDFLDIEIQKPVE